MAPRWLEIVSWCALAAAAGCALWIASDIYARHRRTSMRVMELVWPITALYFGPLAVWGYRRFAPPRTRDYQLQDRPMPPEPDWCMS